MISFTDLLCHFWVSVYARFMLDHTFYIDRLQEERETLESNNPFFFFFPTLPESLCRFDSVEHEESSKHKKYASLAHEKLDSSVRPDSKAKWMTYFIETLLRQQTNKIAEKHQETIFNILGHTVPPYK